MMTDEYSLQDLLEQFKGAMEMSSTPVSEIQIITKNNSVWIRTWWSWLASWGLVFWDSAFSLLICSWFGRSQSWSFWSLWDWVQVTQQSIADIDIIVPTTKNPSHYLELVKALSNKISIASS
jgi:hypothetical protein